MKKIEPKFSDFFSSPKKASLVLLRADQAIKAFSLLTTCLLIAYLVVYNVLNLIEPGLQPILITSLPLLLSAAVLAGAWTKTDTNPLLIITWLLPASMIVVSIYYPAINYSNIVLTYILLFLFLDYTKKQQLAGFLYLIVTYILIQLRYQYTQTESNSYQFFILEIIMVSVFSIILFILLIRIKKEFIAYQEEIRAQKGLLENKNNSLTSLVSFSEQQKNKLKLTVLLKEKLISVIAHDIRTPLNAYKALIDDYKKGVITDKMIITGLIDTQKTLTKIDEMVLGLVNSPDEDDNTSNNPLVNSTNFASTMDAVLSLYSLSAQNKKLVIVPAIEMPENICLTLPKREFEIMLRNLISNSIKFSNPGGRIFVSLKAVPGISSSMATLSVKDYGVGIDTETLKRLNSNKMTSSIGTLDEVGLGVGLSIVFDVIHNHNLRYTIESRKNEGTEFSINIPMLSS